MVQDFAISQERLSKMNFVFLHKLPPWTYRSRVTALLVEPSLRVGEQHVFIPDNLEGSLKVKAGNETHQRR